MEILAECDTSPKQQLEPWVKCQSQSTLCALLSPFILPAIKDDSPLLNLHGVCYLEKKWEGKGAAWECHIHWWTCRNIHPEGACFFSTFLWMNRMSYPCILTLSYIFGHLLQVHLCGFSIFDKTSSYMHAKWIERLLGISPSMHLKFE